MKKFFKIFAVAALACATFVACEQEFDSYDPAAMESTAQVYFSKDAATTINILGEESVEIPVMRAVNGAGVTANVTATVDAEYADLFTIPTSVSFADGETSTSLVITFDPAKLTYGEKYAVSLQIAADMITDYGKDVINLTLDYPEPLKSLGMGLFTDDAMAPLFSMEAPTFEVEIIENTVNPNVLYAKNAYGGQYWIDVFGAPDSFKDMPDSYLEFDITDPNKVQIKKQSLGVDLGYGTNYIFTDYTGKSEFGTFKDGIISFPVGTVYIEDGDGAYAMNRSGLFRLVMPGVVLADYSLSLIANGTKVVDGKAYPVVDAIFGADVAQMTMAVLPGHYQNDKSVWSQVPALIEQGVFEAVTVDAYDQTVEEDKDSEVARMSIVGPEALEAGIYTAFVIPVNADGEAQLGDIQAISFYVNEVNTNVPTFDFLQFGCLPTQFPIPAYVAYYCPTAKDHNSFVMYYETTNYIREWKQVVAKTEALDKFFEANKDVTLEKFAQVNGTDVELENINYIDEDYGYGSEFLPFEGLAPKTSYSVVDYVVDIYGNVYCQRVDVTTAADPDAKEEDAKAEAKSAKFFRTDVAVANDMVLRSDLLE